ncbi:hypothetical protein I308_103073 [Cryptococcus tetragattii IND107]|uniref:TLC domain-containing protein n=1 Tax=Cryptococcus tetragattii IND107 TaxID=1296105 RepID=A0ABR3BS33_9TREE|nr:acyl-CoA-dependent ceramide synthase [Cryptococcus tetragattii IND107]
MSQRHKHLHRRRASSVTVALDQIPLNHSQQSPSPEPEVRTLPGSRRQTDRDRYRSKGLWSDIKTGRWLLAPAASFKLSLIAPSFYLIHHLLTTYGIINHAQVPNVFEHFVLPSNKLEDGRYGKSWWDFAFLANYVIFWTFVRQFVTVRVLRPMAKALGVKGQKIVRFTEQGYAVFYFGLLGACGLYVMHDLPIWWFKTKHFWLEYPHRKMTFQLKTYYLLQAAYWLQQTIILIAKIEKPRKDYNELVAHHIVTLWLVGWSYTFYLTYIGVAVFITMDVSDLFLGLAKCVNYVSEFYSVPLFAWFTIVWTYMRHYLNIVILYSVWAHFDLIPLPDRTTFDPLNDQWIDWWMKWQIFTPILLLQVLNLIWYYLILRILVRALFLNDRRDERSDNEDEVEGDEVKEE